MLYSNKNIDTSYKYHIYNSKRNKLEILSNLIFMKKKLFNIFGDINME